MSVMEEFGNNDIGCTSLNVIIPATSYMTKRKVSCQLRRGKKEERRKIAALK